MHNHLIKRHNYDPRAGRRIATLLPFLKSWKDAWMSRKARRERVKAALNAHTLYDIGEEDLRPRPNRSALFDHNPYTLLVDAMNRDPVEFDPRR